MIRLGARILIILALNALHASLPTTVARNFAPRIAFQSMSALHCNAGTAGGNANPTGNNDHPTTTTTPTPTSSSWSVELGTWTDAQVPGFGIDSLPSPLYIFGYGSLLWRPGKFLDQLPCYEAVAIGWRRMFNQLSCDHRGTVEFPGLVLTLVDSHYLQSVGWMDEEECHCVGAVWEVPESQVSEVVAELDYREKGGYQRQLIKVQLHQDTKHHQAGEVTEALVYIASTENPNFFRPAPHRSNRKQQQYITEMVVDIVSVARGPSGPNVDYLLNLVDYLNDRKYHDEHLNHLAYHLRRRLGPWRSHPLMSIGKHASLAGGVKTVVSWGSNEFRQVSHELMDDVVLRPSGLFGADGATMLESDDSEPIWALAGGGTSATLHRNGMLTLWGTLASQLLSIVDEERKSQPPSPHVVSIPNIRGAAIGHDHMLIILQSGWVVSIGNNSHAQCSGIDEITSSFLVHLGSNAQLSNENIAITQISSSAAGTLGSILSLDIPRQRPLDSATIVKVAVGLRHSAAVTSSGHLVTWGDNKFNQGLGSLASWQPPDGAWLHDVACGARHTALLDTLGRMWLLGENKYVKPSPFEAQSVRVVENVPKLVENLESGVRWQRITSGWSHVLARGVRLGGSLAIVGMGRNDLGQFPVDESSNSRMPGAELLPRSLAALPNGNLIREIWTGSEFSMALDCTGLLWSSGWNDHANLGTGDCATVRGWVAVMDGEGRHMTVQEPWEGSVACGGGHVVCIS